MIYIYIYIYTRTSQQAPQASVNMLNGPIHDSTVIKIWDKYGMFGRLWMAARFRFAKLHLNKTVRLLEQCSLKR